MTVYFCTVSLYIPNVFLPSFLFVVKILGMEDKPETWTETKSMAKMKVNSPPTNP